MLNKIIIYHWVYLFGHITWQLWSGYGHQQRLLMTDKSFKYSVNTFYTLISTLLLYAYTASVYYIIIAISLNEHVWAVKCKKTINTSTYRIYKKLIV